MRRVLAFGFLAVLLLTSTALADGPETGLVAGKVVNADGEALPGVQITLEGGRGQQVTVTNEGGTYRFSLVPPGAYTVKATLEGFTEAHNAVNVTAGGKADVDLTMRLETAETITVTSEAPMVDKFNVSAGSTVTSEVGAQAAGENRTYYGVINMLPGVTSDAENGAIQGTRPQVNGSHFADNSVFIDGVDTSFARFGGSRVFVPTTATTEIALEAGGMSAEYGRVVGSTTNVIIKSGTNVFHGDFIYGRSDTDWNGRLEGPAEARQQGVPDHLPESEQPVHRDSPRRPTPPTSSSGFRTRRATPTTTSSASADRSSRTRRGSSSPTAENDTLNLDKTLDQEIVDASFEFESTIAKLSFQPSQAHQLSGSYIDAPSKRIYFHTPSHDRWNPTPHDLAGDLATLSWNWSITTDFFLETKLATQTSDENKYLAEPTGRRERRRRAGDRGEAAGSPLPRQPRRGAALAGQQLRQLLGQPRRQHLAQRLDPRQRLRLERVPARPGQPRRHLVPEREPRAQVRRRLAGSRVELERARGRSLRRARLHVVRLQPASRTATSCSRATACGSIAGRPTCSTTATPIPRPDSPRATPRSRSARSTPATASRWAITSSSTSAAASPT